MGEHDSRQHQERLVRHLPCGSPQVRRYLAEFEYRFNRRFDLPDIIPRLVYVALRTPPMPERLLKLRLA